ncbi:MAG TPA: vWA domain-containing protein, partial [Thermoanaerobaculia bacterium]
MRRVLATTTLLLGLAAAPAAADGHVRVVLDLSISMQNNDPGRMALLSTVLLHDLARPNSTQGDTFKVIPFAQAWQWNDPAAPPPTGNRPQIAAMHEKRADFVSQILGLSYDARMTYFYPGLLEAVADLERTPGSISDVRAIVLVTDGVPERATRDRELQLIQEQIEPRLEKANIRLYVLAFGSEAFGHQDFFRQITTSASGLPLGEPFFDPQGRELLTNMLKIFSRTFGYSAGALQRLPGARTVDLEGSIMPGASVAIVLSDQPRTEPTLQLDPPAGGSKSSPDGVRRAATDGGGYSLQWVLSPNPGLYSLDTNAVRGSVAVLRPVELALEVLPVPPRKQTERAIAKTPFPLRIRIKWPNGAMGSPGPVDLSFRVVSGRFRNEDD